MKILALESENTHVSMEEIQPHLMREAQTVWRLVQSGVIREIYFEEEKHTAVIMLEVKNLAEAEEILSQLPLVSEGLIRFDYFPLKPYDGFERLFR